MSAFFKQFLREDIRVVAPNDRRAIFLGALGKHPGWNDHIEEDERVPNLGLRTESLVQAKSLLYVQGIARQIDSGAWEKLEPAQQLADFKHIFLWLAGDQMLLGRMWSSSDGKGRTHYPMVIVAQCLGASLDWGLSTVLPQLEKLEQQCRQTTAAAGVAAALDQARNTLRHALEEGSSLGGLLSAPDLAGFCAHPRFGANQEGLHRILYQFTGQAAPYGPDQFSVRSDVSALRPQEIRVPAGHPSPAKALALWARLFSTLLHPEAPLLLVLPLGEDWLDAILGEPDSDCLFCLRAAPAKLPCASDIPFNLDPAFRQQALGILEQFRAGNRGNSGTSTSVVSRFVKTLGGVFRNRSHAG